ncbi:MAG: class I SAM-dependent methyltransferase [Rickettsiales bacterium]|jgi:hypothetical protein|nr:class I SAM-dependent methyltransferase [Rickettsiales bacterium]
MDKETSVYTGLGTDGVKIYETHMETSINDKKEFIKPYIQNEKVGLIVDFGCSNGAFFKSLIEEKDQVYKNIQCIGYDLDDGALGRARKNVPNGKFFNGEQTRKLLSRVEKFRKNNPTKKVLINMSSFLHEVYSYAEYQSDIDKVYGLIDSIKPDFIAIRDFYMTKDEKHSPIRRDILIKANRALRSKQIDISRSSGEKQSFAPIIKAWNICHVKRHDAEQKQLMHLLLTSRYREDKGGFAMRELLENYMKVSDDKIRQISDLGGGYTIVERGGKKDVARSSTPSFVEYLKKEARLSQEQIDSLPKTKIKLVLERTRP